MKERNMMKKAMLLKIFIIAILCCWLSGCDAGLLIVGMEVNTYPDRIVYFMGVDDSLDLSGGTVNLLLKAGTKSIARMNSGEVTITHNIKFNEPGVYVVTLERAGYTCNFPIQVVDLASLPVE